MNKAVLVILVVVEVLIIAGLIYWPPRTWRRPYGDSIESQILAKYMTSIDWGTAHSPDGPLPPSDRCRRDSASL